MKEAKDQKEAARERAREIAEGFLSKGDDYGWFEELYESALGQVEKIPWADLEPNRFLVEWEKDSPLNGEGKSALVVGCGLGDDAKFLAERGFDVTAFDVSPAAVKWARTLYGSSGIEFAVADLFDPPSDWLAAFDLVLEVYTVQALPLHLREASIRTISGFVADEGELVVVSRWREQEGEPVGPPWGLSPDELHQFESHDLNTDSLSEYFDEEDEVTRFVAHFQKVRK